MSKLTLTIVRGNNLDITITTGSERNAGKLTYKAQYWERKATETDWGDPKDATNITFKLNLANIRFDKKMYSPNELEADIQLSVESSDSSKVRKAFISRDGLLEIFANQRVELICDDHKVLKACYVHDIIPRRSLDEMFVTLKIYSVDKLMTLEPYCRTFVAKTLSEILLDEDDNYRLPYNSSMSVSSDNSKMQFLKDNGKEHIFPYLVQYNECFYDFLARTTNRWGEFMYFEDGFLTIGCTTPPQTVTTDNISGYSLLTWHDLTDKQKSQKNAGSYAGEAPYDNNFTDSKVKRDKYDSVKGVINSDIDHGADTFWMGKVGQLFTNDKSISNFFIEGTVDDLVSLRQKSTIVNENNTKINDKYLDIDNADVYEDAKKTILKPQYEKETVDGETVLSTYNQFTETSPIVDASKYATIIANEQKAGKNAIKVEYDTTFPKLKLGDVITLDGKSYIVVEVEGYQPEIIVKDAVKDIYVHSYSTSEIRYRITAIAAIGDQFYPMMIPAGHVRKSGPQVAVVVDVDDPLRANRVRIKFPWQLKDFIDTHDKDTNLDEKDKIKTYENLKAEHFKDYGKKADDASPWLLYASASGPVGAGVHGRHYLAEKVLVDFAGGNVERPIVVGAVSRDVPGGVKTGSAVLAAPNGESVKVYEGSGSGVGAFLTGMSPGFKLLRGFGVFNDAPTTKDGESLEGGVDIGDKYGIWSIKGSTHDRNISIKSPWGDVKIDAFTGITINAPNGDVKIKGKNISLEAGNNLTLTSGKNIKNQLFPSLGKGGKVWGLDLLQQVTAAVTTKLMSMGLGIFDLRLLRNVFEVFLRPDEGLLEIKSNRFLKLESGKGNANYPDSAYRNASEVRVATFKARSAASEKPYLGRFFRFEDPFMLDKVDALFTQFKQFVDYYANVLLTKYNLAQASKQTLDGDLTQLKQVADPRVDPNGKEIPPVDNYATLIADAWTQDISQNYADLTIADIPFNDNVKVDGITDPNILGPRQTARTNFLTHINNLRHKVFMLMKNAEITISENDAKNRVLNVAGFSQDTIKNLVEAVQSDALKEIGKFTDDEKELKSAFPAQFRGGVRQAASRKLAMALLDILGFDDTTRVEINNVLPKRPVNDAEFTGPEWNNYVDSIKKFPRIKKDDIILLGKKNLKSFEQAWDNIAVWRAVSEYTAWGDNAKGDILFSSGHGTYKLGLTNEQILGAHSAGILDETDVIQSERNLLNNIRTTLKGL